MFDKASEMQHINIWKLQAKEKARQTQENEMSLKKKLKLE